jgi:hypothetical protein
MAPLSRNFRAIREGTARPRLAHERYRRRCHIVTGRTYVRDSCQLNAEARVHAEMSDSQNDCVRRAIFIPMSVAASLLWPNRRGVLEKRAFNA